VLISEYQPATKQRSAHSWVWEVNGQRLRLVRSYPALDADQIIAAPW
jgi:hypothetical protein